MLRTLGVVAGAVLALAALQSGLALLPVENGIHNAEPLSATSSTRREAGPFLTSLAWDLRHVVRGQVNRAGFLSPHEFKANEPSIALFGDSFVEGKMASFEQSLAGQLEGRLAAAQTGQPGVPLLSYNFGISGAALPHYLGLAREVSPLYALKGAVLVVIPGDYEEGFKPMKGQYGWAESATELIQLQPAGQRPKGLRAVLDLALVRYLRGNLKVDLLPLFRHPASGGQCQPATLDVRDEQNIDRYLQALPQALNLPPERIVMLFNRMPYGGSVYRPIDRPARASVEKASAEKASAEKAPAETACPTRDSLALARLQARASQSGIRVVDAQPILQADYARNRRLLDFSPIDDHWNERAISLVAAAIAQRLQTD